MPYQTARAGLAEACLDGLKAAIVAKIADLNTQLQTRSAPLSSLTMTSGMVYVGDTETLPDAATNPFWICVVGGGRADGRDTHIEINASGPQYRATIWHNLYFYLHSDTFPVTAKTAAQAFVQAEARERLRALVQDWLTWDVFNNPTGIEITLTSRQFAVAPAFDKHTRTLVEDVTKGYIFKSFGGTSGLFMAHYMVSGLLLGGW